MTTDLTYPQIASIVAFVVALFVLYRLLVSKKDATIGQKDATIQLLRERITQLERERQSPDALLQSVKEYKLALEEIARSTANEVERRKLAAQALEQARLEGQLELQRVLDAQFSALLKIPLSPDRTYTTRPGK